MLMKSFSTNLWIVFISIICKGSKVLIWEKASLIANNKTKFITFQKSQIEKEKDPYIVVEIEKTS